ncbi:MAG: GNAT family N-acetyltransferase [Terriglobia bacterium]
MESWLTGCRLVSLPFSDHCQPLVDRPEDRAIISAEIQRYLTRGRCKSAELRPLASGKDGSVGLSGFGHSEKYCFHKLDLRPSLDTLFRNFHASCIQRKIQRGERERLEYQAGWSEPLLAKFYHLLLLTRRRHQLPPQPLRWFRNLLSCLGESATIHILAKDRQAVAGILTLSYGRTRVYKYGCSDARFHNLGGMPLLMWKAIQDAKGQGADEFDLGRSDLDHAGLIAFKDHLGAARSTLTYYKYPVSRAVPRRLLRARQLALRAFALMPSPALRAAGNLLYRHIG